MRTATTIAAGLLAGIGGALLVNATASSDPHPAPAEARRAPIAGPVATPPGWDRHLVANELDHRVAALEARAAQIDAPTSDREQDKLVHYQAELTAQEARVADHAREPLDSAWATDATARIRTASATTGVTARAVDCRSQTCVVTLAFPSPTEALAYLGARDMSKLVDGFSGLVSTPVPPQSAGAYELTVVLQR